MLETCKSCGTVFDIDKTILSKKIKWLKCSVCNQKWNLPEDLNVNSKHINSENKFNNLEDKDILINNDEKVKNELASIKLAVQDKTKNLSQKKNPVLELKNKSVAEIAHELSASKSSSNNEFQKNKSINEIKNISKTANVLPIIFLILILLFSSVLYFRSTLISYSFLYFPNYVRDYFAKLNELSNSIKLPILANLNYLDLKDFAATFQDKKVKFSGVIKNNSKRPMLAPRVKILAVREDRKIIFEKILVLNDKIVMPSSEIRFSKSFEMERKKENVSVKATLLKKIYDL